MGYPPIKERFHTRYSVQPSGCWDWVGKCYPNGYGSLQINYKSCLAHRVSWELYRSPIPEGHVVCHGCDNRRCVNPDHLFLGTQKENVDDMMRKKRNKPPRGVRSGKTHLTESDVKRIRARAAAGELQKDIAHDHGLSSKQISVIVARKQWAHI